MSGSSGGLKKATAVMAKRPAPIPKRNERECSIVTR